MNPFRIIYYNFYLLQLENYDVTRFMRTLIRQPLPPRELRQKIIWTAKIKVVLAISALLCLLFLLTQNIVWITLAFILFFSVPALFIVSATLLLLPIDILLKRRVIIQARKKLAQFPNLKIIAITGSYGKTTMKEMCAAILQEKYIVLKTPENINTPIGIARLILQKLNPQTEICIVEMGAYQKGDIAALCALMPPDIAIITGINEAHLERFGNIKNTIAAKFELVDYAKKDALIVLNEDNEFIVKKHKEHTVNHTTVLYSTRKGTTLPPLQLLGDYARGTARGALLVGKALGIPAKKSIHALHLLKPLPHRLQPILTPDNILIIDDSYNGNTDGAREAIRVLARYKDRRKIYLTPGLVEAGRRNKKIHETLGRQLARVADIVILIKNSATVYIQDGLLAAEFPREKIREFTSALEAHRALSGILQSNDVILFQNDWPDNYF